MSYRKPKIRAELGTKSSSSYFSHQTPLEPVGNSVRKSFSFLSMGFREPPRQQRHPWEWSTHGARMLQSWRTSCLPLSLPRTRRQEDPPHKPSLTLRASCPAQRLQTTNKTVGDNVEQRKEMCLFLCNLGNPGLPGPRRAWACSHLQALLTVGESSSQWSGREEWGLPVSDHTGETGEASGTSVSINVLRNFVTS